MPGTSVIVKSIFSCRGWVCVFFDAFTCFSLFIHFCLNILTYYTEDVLYQPVMCLFFSWNIFSGTLITPPPSCLEWFGLTLLASQTRSVYLPSTRHTKGLLIWVAEKRSGSRGDKFSKKPIKTAVWLHKSVTSGFFFLHIEKVIHGYMHLRSNTTFNNAILSVKITKHYNLLELL